jgi:preprotein translocase subunit SecG
MQFILVLIHVAVCVALILIVLLQRGKGAGMGAAFGGSTQTVFGSAGATPFLAKITTGAAVVFMLTSLGLSIFFGRGTGSSIMESAPVPPPELPPIEEQAQPPAPPSGTESSNPQDQPVE